MSNTPIQLTVDLNKVLEQINQNLDAIQKDITDLKIGQTRLEAELKGDLKNLEGEVKG